MTVIVALCVTSALLVGAAWGLWGRFPKSVEGALLAIAGGALIVSAVQELMQPAIRQGGEFIALSAMVGGALVFTGLDWLVDKKLNGGGAGGFGLLLAITLDGVPENLALGVALIGASPMSVLALAGSIFLSNLPEAAGGARGMQDSIGSKGKIFALWTFTALILAGSTIAGNLLLADVGLETLSAIRAFAAGAVIASLATEVFPKAFREDQVMAGVFAAIGVMLALLMGA